MPRDLFGKEQLEAMMDAPLTGPRRVGRPKRKPTKKNGYADIPGMGPAGETCGSCAHLFRNRCSKTYLKCGLMRARWTGGEGTDVLAKSPACRRWEVAPQKSEEQ